MAKPRAHLGRRAFLRRGAGALGAAAAFPTLIPASVFGGPGRTSPSERANMGFIGIGGQGGGHLRCCCWQATMAEPPPRDAFTKVRLAEKFHAEGAFYGDFNRDGWVDILCVPFSGKEGLWYENPRGVDAVWTRHSTYPMLGNESPVWGDVTGDGTPEVVFCTDGSLGYAVSSTSPSTSPSASPWVFHPQRFAEAAAQMLVGDIDGDGLADVVTAWHCHRHGLLWCRQIRGADGGIEWRQQAILSPAPDVSSSALRVSQLHAQALVDMNGDLG